MNKSPRPGGSWRTPTSAKKPVLQAGFLLLFSYPAFARQSIRTPNEKGVPLQGPTFLVKGAGGTVVTDQQGNSTLNVPPAPSTMPVSFIRCASRKIAVGNQTSLITTLVGGPC
jgi:hypothetical protein